MHFEFIRQPSHTWLSEYPQFKGMYPCTKFQICPFVDRTNVFKDGKGQNEYEISDLINCSTTRVIYMITCPCPKMYIGKTKRPLKVRIGEHLRHIRKEKRETQKKIRKNW